MHQIKLFEQISQKNLEFEQNILISHRNLHRNIFILISHRFVEVFTSDVFNSNLEILDKLCGVCISRNVNTIFQGKFLLSFSLSLLKSRVPWYLTLKFQSKNVNKSSSPINSVCEADKSKQKSIRTRTICHIRVSKLAMRYFCSLFPPVAV